ncbi:hypothetical protein HPB51_006110 [Rhipicephalus microplus]|uniref:Exportin-1/Importin-beta-like domain-containing protein n=1 Tax=Rhipicephalus microplus TaxID=6941 RepID=A0A9J6ER19_RHIMP|nr:hypothetical protein HPB51_006110 [Rhipicephalus microplus]
MGESGIAPTQDRSNRRVSRRYGFALGLVAFGKLPRSAASRCAAYLVSSQVQPVANRRGGKASRLIHATGTKYYTGCHEHVSAVKVIHGDTGTKGPGCSSEGKGARVGFEGRRVGVARPRTRTPYCPSAVRTQRGNSGHAADSPSGTILQCTSPDLAEIRCLACARIDVLSASTVAKLGIFTDSVLTDNLDYADFCLNSLPLRFGSSGLLKLKKRSFTCFSVLYMDGSTCVSLKVSCGPAQDAISRRGLDLSARQELRSSLQHLLLSAQQQPAYVRNKLSKLLVDLACVDWPHNEPSFFDDIAQLCQSEETRPLGLLLLQTTSEEVATAPRGNVTAARLDELRHLVVQQMPRMWALITGVLKSGSDGGVNIHRALQCTEHLLSWLPLSAVDPKLVDALCCLCATAAASASQESQTQVDTEELGALSLSCLCEALSRATASDMGSDCLRLLQQFAMGALQAAIPSAAAASSHNSYLDKLMEFLRLFVSASLPCFEGNSPALPQLLSLLYEYTFRESSAERYCVCLEMWGTLLVRLAAHRSADSYRPLLQTLVSQLLARCCQAEGAAQSLQEPQLALVAKAAELTPQDVCAQVLSLLDPELDHYQSPHGGSAAERLRSLSAVLQALGRLAPHLDVSLAHTTTTRRVRECKSGALCHAAIYGRQLLANADAARAADVANAQAHLLASLRLLCTYLGSKSPPTELVVEAALPPILEQCPENVCRAACGLLLSLSSSVRPAQLLSLEPMQQLCEQLCQGSLRPLSPQCEQLVVQAAHAALCLPWSGVPAAAQCWDQRAVAQSSLVNALAQPLLQKQPPVNTSLLEVRNHMPTARKCEQLVVQAAHAALCLPWSGVPAAAQCWDQRAVAQSSLVNALAQPLLQKQPPGEPVNRSLRLLRALVEVLEGSGSRSKQVASTGLAPVWPLLLERLPATLQGLKRSHVGYQRPPRQACQLVLILAQLELAPAARETRRGDGKNDDDDDGTTGLPP